MDWIARLTAGLNRSIPNTNQTMGDLERQILQQTQGLERKLLEEASQKKADQSPPVCPVCGNKLSRVSHGHERTFQSRFGPVTIRRSRGWCKRCKTWRFPADYALGLEETGSASPSVQEMAALLASKMPVAEASKVIEHLTGVKLPPATLDREARRQGQRAERKRQELDEQMSTAQGSQQCVPLEQQPFSLVIEIDAWNIRERDDWGKSRQQRARGIGAGALALGLRRHVFSFEPAAAERYRPIDHLESRHGNDARWDRCLAPTTVCRVFAARLGQGGRRVGRCRWGHVDLELGGRPFWQGRATAGFLSCQPAPVGGGSRLASGGCAGGAPMDRTVTQETQSGPVPSK